MNPILPLTNSPHRSRFTFYLSKHLFRCCFFLLSYLRLKIVDWRSTSLSGFQKISLVLDTCFSWISRQLERRISSTAQASSRTNRLHNFDRRALVPRRLSKDDTDFPHLIEEFCAPQFTTGLTSHRNSEIQVSNQATSGQISNSFSFKRAYISSHRSFLHYIMVCVSISHNPSLKPQ